ncbi:MAG: monovalent cation/H+ antiporter complex subunit F [Canibacter sp.]
MTIPQLIVAWGGGLSLGITAMLALIRAIIGPGILDRIIASDVVLTTIVLALGADMVLRGHTSSIPIMIVISASAAFATIIVARYVRRSAGQHRQSMETGEPKGGGSND